MPPIDGQMQVQVPPGVPQGGGTIALDILINYIIQRTYHDLTVLSELLPRKTDMERKIEIVQFATRTRQLFIRLLALVKWASSATKVDKCSEICNLLEQQSMWFVDTADMLAKMARETLVNARLPNFSIPCAIDVLTLGTYPRLPTCIREKIVPEDSITPAEKRLTLSKLTQVIQYRLVSTDLPQQMRKLRVENGRVKFVVEHEFEVTLTLMGDSPTIPWRLLDINILVDDPETGNGKSLVHSLQVNYIHQLAQSRLLDNDRPIHDLYRVLHSFCQSLQLEVLNSQTQRLIRERMGDSIRVEEYLVGKSLVVSYWRDQLKRDKQQQQPQQEPVVYKLTIHVSEEDWGRPLQISHTPPMSPEESHRVGLAIKSNHLSIERLLMQTIEVRTHAKLQDLAKEMKRYKVEKCEMKDLPTALHIPVLQPCMESEHLRIMIDSQRGTMMASTPAQTDLQIIDDITECLNNDKKGLDKLIVSLRLQLCLLRCEKSIQYLQTTCLRHLPLINLENHQLDTLGPHKLYIRIPKQSSHYVVLSLREKKDRCVEFKYYLVETTACTADGTELDLSDDIGAKLFRSAGRLLPLDTFAFTHGPYSKVFDDEEETEIELQRRKRKVLLGEMEEPHAKRQKGAAYYVPELSYILASCEERIPLVAVGHEFERNGVVHSGIQVDSEGSCFCLSILSLPDVEGCEKRACEGLKKALLSLKLRILNKPSRNWIVEFLFAKALLETANKKESGSVQRVIFMHELNLDNLKKVVKEVIDEWYSICHLYSLVAEFAEIYNDQRSGLRSTVDVHSYSYRKLTLVYGPNRSSLVHIQWKSDSKQFVVTFGTIGPSVTINPHVIMSTQIQQELSCHRNLAQIAQVLHDTWSPLMSINKLTNIIIHAPIGNNTNRLAQSFCIIPQSTTHVRISYRSISSIDVHFRSNKIVAIESSKVVEGFNPISLLKAFLNMYVDDAIIGRHNRRMSTTEDDSPSSPVGMDTMDMFGLSSGPSMGSPASRQRQDGGLRFPSPMTPPSNPHTPASPSAARMSGIAPSPSTALIGTPSPGTLLGAGSPGNPQLHVPSPSSFVPTPSPGSLGMHMQSPASQFMGSQGMEGSPFASSGLAMPSPGQRNWPNSPSVPGPSPVSRHGTATSPGHPALHSPQTMKDGEHSKPGVMGHPSRVFTHRSWAASIPTLLSHNAFDTLLTPLGPGKVTSPLERFFGCVLFTRNLPRIIQNEENLNLVRSSDANVVIFKVDTMQFRVSFNATTLQSLHMNATNLPDSRDPFPTELINILERFFEVKVATHPYKVNALRAFCRLLPLPSRILKDCIQIMRLEMMNETRNTKWTVAFCLTIPPSALSIAPAGAAAIAVKQKMVLMLQLTRADVQLPMGVEPQSIIVQLLYDFNANTVVQMEVPSRSQPAQQPTQAHMAVSAFLKKIEMHQNTNECALFPTVHKLMQGLVVPG
ncbi:mediator of RNA polymerase II transcription subunit 14-like [Ylistrum balloti]|uniref:mediator of RNA polymerase II transcription subunit 14-like n=1 Tax=Ylistrum balloti TaxID=509963 RepID=UPI002905A67C|nr:mediator of RNA polymerase II transcription subunit 14-like [Ylistrum balloti]